SLPPAYDLQSVASRTVKVEVNEPAQTDIVVRALRSVYGSVSCAGSPAEGHQVVLYIDHAPSASGVDQNGNFKIGDLSSGGHEFIISYGSIRFTRQIELPAEPANLEVNFEVCAGDASTQLQSRSFLSH
ncbi:MAG TPA: hypothetical protein VFA15_07825, partial [Nitrososphaera sp.]|nr:hypothetical protein [Nitrososphaera sp.]